MNRITVVGGGGTAIALASYLVVKEFDVKLFDMEQYGAALKDIIDAGEINMIGDGPRGTVKAPKITFDPKEAFSGTDVIFICMVATRHKELCEFIAPHIEEGQTVLFFNGNCGSFWLKKYLGRKDVVVGESMGNFIPNRLAGKATVSFAADPDSHSKKVMAAFPAKDNGKLKSAIEGIFTPVIYPEVPYKNVLEVALNAPNVSVHLAASLLCVSSMERSQDFRLYRDGLSPSILAFVRKVEEEKASVFTAMGYTPTFALAQLQACYEFDEKPVPGLAGFRLTTGPDCAQHRYITEDAYAGDSMMISLGKLTGVDTPLFKSIVTIASALNDTDFYSKGNTLENFGLNHMSVAELNEYLNSGVLSQ